MPHRVFRTAPSRAALRGLLVITLLVASAACSGSRPATTADATSAKAKARPAAEPGRTPPDEVADLPEIDEVDDGLEDPAAGAAGRMAEALEAYESAEVFWQGGSFDDAFAALDRAYALMAEVDPEAAGDDGAVSQNGLSQDRLAQDKDNLRRLISRRLVEIYASRQTAVGDLDRAIPLVVNDEVAYEIRRFQGPERAFFLDSYRRSGLYRPMMVAALREAGLPEQLSWLPLVESGFKTRAFSTARALGLWQFISSTGARYDLDRTQWVDQRMDPEHSTRAAIAYLTDLHGLFGDWMAALAAYNCGEGRVLRTMQRQPVSYFDRFWDLYEELPRETRRYVPRFLAVLAILDDPKGYGFDLPQPLPAPETTTLAVARPLKLASIDEALGLAPGTLANLNPELRDAATPPQRYVLRVPVGVAEDAGERVAAMEEWKEAPPDFATHRVRSGETLSRVASAYGAEVEEIVALNRLRSAHHISPGQQLRVPDRRHGGGPSTGSVAATVPQPVVSETRVRVKSGDSLWNLARRHGTTADRIRRDNHLRGNLLQPGQELVIRTGAGGAASSQPYTVRRGDTLGGIARHHGVSLAKLLHQNSLSKRSTIFPGQTLQIPN